MSIVPTLITIITHDIVHNAIRSRQEVIVLQKIDSHLFFFGCLCDRGGFDLCIVPVLVFGLALMLVSSLLLKIAEDSVCLTQIVGIFILT